MTKRLPREDRYRKNSNVLQGILVKQEIFCEIRQNYYSTN